MSKQPEQKSKPVKGKSNQVYEPVEEVIEDIIDDEEVVEKEIIKSFTPKEKKEPYKANLIWFSSFDLELLKSMLVGLDEAYLMIKGRWEMEDRITKLRKEYLQSLYDKTQDIRFLIKQKTK